MQGFNGLHETLLDVFLDITNHYPNLKLSYCGYFHMILLYVHGGDRPITISVYIVVCNVHAFLPAFCAMFKSRMVLQILIC